MLGRPAEKILLGDFKSRRVCAQSYGWNFRGGGCGWCKGSLNLLLEISIGQGWTKEKLLGKVSVA